MQNRTFAPMGGLRHGQPVAPSLVPRAATTGLPLPSDQRPLYRSGGRHPVAWSAHAAAHDPGGPRPARRGGGTTEGIPSRSRQTRSYGVGGPRVDHAATGPAKRSIARAQLDTSRPGGTANRCAQRGSHHSGRSGAGPDRPAPAPQHAAPEHAPPAPVSLTTALHPAISRHTRGNAGAVHTPPVSPRVHP